MLSGNDVELDVLFELNDRDLAQLGLSLDHRRKLIAAAQRLKNASAAPAPSSPAPSIERAREQQAERRPIS